MPDYREAFPGKYLKSTDLGSNRPTVTIREIQKIRLEDKTRLVAYFKGKELGLLLNKTNAKKIAEIVGSNDYEEWVGKPVRLYVTTTEYQGRETDCIRVDFPEGKAPAADDGTTRF